ncbi:ribonuclease HI [Yamadazyma tenuis]|uniref:Ribonuclease H n=1 Tax=Candida tenuis (strain ATCC 10573 / BCRC 21748 / CBS 615 / JCM 9827 / NBRC 10315 / NRRL Y-1498 / VKM Y-70) TaxID=590646 RepID=G3B6M0_CANTC|nr:ribonuclease H-like protein [Yamadazyma tenuis ATCC 10573]EGV63701.1 ribonuclease H-like protein [Yamadazyma tenuis ATCC 10573]WEJ96675.1 ribonuclease HI [Yamadazyma tenuis]
MPYYAVASGFETGVFRHWTQVKPLVDGYSKPVFKKFNDEESAKQFIRNNSMSSRVVQTRRYGTLGRVESGTVSSSVSTTKKNSTCTPLQVEMKLNSLNMSYNFEDWRTVEQEIKWENHLISSDQKIEIYCDGAAKNNGKSNALAGYGVYIKDLSPKGISVAYDQISIDKLKPTNQFMELYAIRHALMIIFSSLEHCKRYEGKTSIKILTDSQFSINCLTVWYKNWESNGWVNTAGRPVIHQQCVRDCLKLIDSIKDSVILSIEYVPGHSGFLGNEVADRLANIACDSMSSRIC